ncbi:hypothetical protein [Leptospira andrefontaineae]|uniref:TIGR04454 family lipoprotein n=1 Tax=Leptospira andrefontaineae TaxID=2484976 RepID=A0A4R9HDD0_9LEPT|nr:hypothetical protein [Leptospira andrefontaineae]TGK44663.1 hypothetical protein EHO65_01075 [Leptospira andrefontaineae]
MKRIYLLLGIFLSIACALVGDAEESKTRQELRKDDLTRDAYLAVCAKLDDPGDPQNLSAIVCTAIVCDQFDCDLGF